MPVLIRTFPTPAAAVTSQFHATGLTPLSVVRHMEPFSTDWITPIIREIPLYRASLKAQTGFIRLLALNVSLQFIGLVIFDEPAAGPAKTNVTL